MPRPEAVDAPERDIAKMTTAERDEYVMDLRKQLRELRRPDREVALRAGKARPGNLAEAEIFASDLIKRGRADDEDLGG